MLPVLGVEGPFVGGGIGEEAVGTRWDEMRRQSIKRRLGEERVTG